MKDPAEFIASGGVWDFGKDIPPRTGHDLMRQMLQLFNDGYRYCMDIISPEGVLACYNLIQTIFSVPIQIGIPAIDEITGYGVIWG